MFRINKISLCSPVDYAAEELKKYLRMMMPEYSEIVIGYEPSAAEGFRLGLMQDFGLDVSDAEDPILDDILYIDTDEHGGIIAGDNPRSVLLAVYESASPRLPLAVSGSGRRICAGDRGPAAGKVSS